MIAVTARFIATQDMPLAELHRYPGNARRSDVDSIRESLRRNGQYRGMVVRVHEGRHTILAGNHTADALEAEGFATGRCELIECDDDEAQRIMLADNRIPERGDYDQDALEALLAGLDGDYEGTGWTAEDVAAMFDQDDADEGGDAPEDQLPDQYGVIVECDTEHQQAALLRQLDLEGFRVRALMS